MDELRELFDVDAALKKGHDTNIAEKVRREVAAELDELGYDPTVQREMEDYSELNQKVIGAEE